MRTRLSHNRTLSSAGLSRRALIEERHGTSDPSPDVFVFANESNAVTSTVTISNIVQVSGTNCQIPVSISGSGSPQFRICADSGCTTVVQGWTSSPSSISSSQYLQLRLTSDSAGGSPFQASVIAGSAATTWTVATAGGDCVGSTPVIGTVCVDGTIYAGLSPDGNVKMFTTRCDAGQTWNGSTCTGTRLLLPWNNGSANWFATGFVSVSAGQANTVGLIGSSDIGAPYAAAVYCDTLTMHGNTDWYLPARGELSILYSGQDAIRNFDTSGSFYWTSSESNNAFAMQRRFSDGAEAPGGWNGEKRDSKTIRCVRR